MIIPPITSESCWTIAKYSRRAARDSDVDRVAGQHVRFVERCCNAVELMSADKRRCGVRRPRILPVVGETPGLDEHGVGRHAAAVGQGDVEQFGRFPHTRTQRCLFACH